MPATQARDGTQQHIEHPKTREQKDRYNAQHRQRYRDAPECRQRQSARMHAYNAERRKERAMAKTTTRTNTGMDVPAAASASRSAQTRKAGRRILRA
ncbi:hypothetical protein FHX77_000326 [Bifidobacterium commune]|uniref:hypothetical protein n=1 Tax=Bifidobacterium commune TaxID=1505727 RepID=UPI000B83339F|nr:hypothetical protein [Bifidobacterium commune]MBB2954946.1 hypothetical protein [Bifidobacterium commune]